MIKIPQDLTFSQTNTGEYSGNILQTKNISFNDEGLITLEKRTRAVFDSDTTTFLDDGTVPGFTKIVQNDSDMYIITNGGIGVITVGSDIPYKPTITKDTTEGTPTMDGTGDNDAVWFNGVLCVVVADGTIYKFDGDDWTETNAQYGSVMLAVFENKQQLAVVGTSGAGFDIIQLYDKDWVEQNKLTLPSNYSITSIDWNNDRLYIGTLDYDTKEAFVFEWDGTSAEANTGYPINAQTVYSVKRYKNGVVVLTSEAELLYINGGIERLAVLPIFNKKQWYVEGNTGNGGRPVQNYGMFVDNDLIYITLYSRYTTDSFSNTSDYFDNNFPSGIWCYDPKVGLYHSFSVGLSKEDRTNAITTASVVTATGIITVAGVTVPETGTPVFYDDGVQGQGTKITPLEYFGKYYTIKLSDTTLKLATTKANALAGTAITLTGTGNNAQSLVFAPNTDFGGIKETPITLLDYRRKSNLTFPKEVMSKFLIGAVVSKKTTGNLYTICTAVNNQENRGYIITPRIKSPNIEDEFRSLILRFKPLINPEDKIIVKYRTTKPTLALRKLYANSVKGTFVNSTSFTTTKLTDVSVGDEVEIVSGAGAGYLAHITDITLDAGTYTVTIDETVENIAASDTFYFVVDNWTKVETLTSASFDNFEIGIGKNSKWIQFKIELRGIDVKIEDLLIDNTKSR